MSLDEMDQECNTCIPGPLRWMGLVRDSSSMGNDPEASMYRVCGVIKSYALLGKGLTALLALVVWPSMFPGEEMAWGRPLVIKSNTANPSNSTPAKSPSEIHVFYHIFRRPEPEVRARADEIISEQQAALRE